MIKLRIAMAVFFLLVAMFGANSVNAQMSTMDNIRLFENIFKDTPISEAPFIEGSLRYDDYDSGNTIGADFLGGYSVVPKFEIDAKLGFIYLSPDKGDNEFGLSDFLISGKYDLSSLMYFMPPDMKIAAGGYFTLPSGQEKVGENKTDFGAFLPIRYPFSSGLVITGLLAVDFIEVYDAGDKDRKTSLHLGTGTIYPITDLTSFIGELNYKSQIDYIFLNGGVDYQIQERANLRGYIGFGLDDGAPDFSLRVSYLYSF